MSDEKRLYFRIKRAATSYYRGSVFFPGLGVLNLSHLDFDIVSTVTCAPGRCPAEDFDIRISSLCYINSTNSYVRNYQRIMQNKPNFQKSQMNISYVKTTNYEQKTMNYANNKQTQFKPNLQNAKNERKLICYRGL